jgi:hypothetical protein
VTAPATSITAADARAIVTGGARSQGSIPRHTFSRAEQRRGLIHAPELRLPIPCRVVKGMQQSHDEAEGNQESQGKA